MPALTMLRPRPRIPAGRPPAATPALPNALAALRATKVALREAFGALDDAVVVARGQGATWRELGRVLDVEHTAVRRRYGVGVDQAVA